MVMPAPQGRAYSAGHFELVIDGVVTPAYLKSVEGGFMKLNSSDVQGGADPIRVKHVTTREVEAMTWDIGMSEVNSLMLWIAQSWRREFNRKSGHVIHADSNYEARLQHNFYDALIEEVGVPALDASSKEALFLKVKIRPERIELLDGDQAKLQVPSRGSQKLWQASAFRLVLDNGIDVSKVFKIDGFTIKQGIKPVTAGRYQPGSFPELEPTKIDFPDLKIHMSMAHAGPVLEWYKMVVIEGQRETDFETTGAIEFLHPDRTKVLGKINLYGVGIKGFSMGKSEANSDQMKRCSFDLYVSHMGLMDDDIRMQLEG
jgi:hypothetical protein